MNKEELVRLLTRFAIADPDGQRTNWPDKFKEKLPKLAKIVDGVLEEVALARGRILFEDD